MIGHWRFAIWLRQVTMRDCACRGRWVQISNSLRGSIRSVCGQPVDQVQQGVPSKHGRFCGIGPLYSGIVAGISKYGTVCSRPGVASSRANWKRSNAWRWRSLFIPLLPGASCTQPCLPASTLICHALSCSARGNGKRCIAMPSVYQRRQPRRPHWRRRYYGLPSDPLVPMTKPCDVSSTVGRGGYAGAVDLSERLQ